MARFDLIHFAKNQVEPHTMRDISILHDLLKSQCPNLHQKRLFSLMVAVQSLLDGQQLSLTELGQNISGPVAAKHNIKRIDRLLGNHGLYQERMGIYRWHARFLCGVNPMPIILIDWSDVREQMRHQTLRASVSFEGRSVILYERVFPFSQYSAVVLLLSPMQGIATPGSEKSKSLVGFGLGVSAVKSAFVNMVNLNGAATSHFIPLLTPKRVIWASVN